MKDTSGFGIAQADLPPFEQGRLDPREWFDRPRQPLHLEIGSGKGTFLVQEAPRNPDVNYLGIERSPEFYRYAADRVRRHALANVRVLHADALEFIRFWCADAVAQVLHLYFSDPWPKSRHHKRRVVQDRTLRDFHRILASGGVLHLVTDHDDLWAWYEDHAARNADLFERRPFAGVGSAGAGELVGSNFERKYQVQGRVFRGMTLVGKNRGAGAQGRSPCAPSDTALRSGMRKPGTDENDVRMNDVLCDFCGREWTDEVPMIEGHQGSCMCARCLELAYVEVVVNGGNTAPGEYTCPMCLEAGADREALDRGGEPGWRSPVREAAICRRCIELAAESLGKDKDFGWQKPD